MRRTLLLLSLTGLGCGSSGASPDPDVRPERAVTVMDRQVLHLTDSPAARVPVSAPPEKVWDALAAVYGQLGIPLTTIDRPNWRLGNQQLTRRQQLAGQRMSLYLSCGQNMSGLKADNDRIHLSVISAIRPAGTGGGSEVSTAVVATAQPIDGTSTDPSICATTGRLEQRIVTAVGEKLGVPIK